MRTLITKEAIKPGMLVKTYAGYTMRHAKFFEVLSVKGAKVILGQAQIKTHSDQYGQEGQYELTGNSNGTADTKAKFTKNGLMLADSSFRVGSYWSPLAIAQIGDKEEFYGD